jgi:predicted NAD-dependent protein-ADP-ribosyltransferase YbiA (DUF1768 family)
MGGSALIDGRKLESTSNFYMIPMTIPGVTVTTKVNDSSSDNINATATATATRTTTVQCTPTDLEWPSVEHYFQAAKFAVPIHDTEALHQVAAHCRAIQLAADPMQAWELGQCRDFPLRNDWEDVKANVMYTAVQAKYQQYPTTLATTFAHTTAPIYAGPSTANWQHMNTIVLERVRYELRQQLELPPLVPVHVYEGWCSITNLPSAASSTTTVGSTIPVVHVLAE